MDRTVTVVGSATAAVEPDCARLTCGVQVLGKDAQDALRRTNEAMQRIVDAVVGTGVARPDVRTSGPNLFRVDKGYSGADDLSILVRDVTAVGAVIDAVAAVAGPDLTMRGVTFSVLDPEEVLSTLRSAAVRDARRIATELAAADGAAVGEALTVSASGASDLPTPVVRRAATLASTPVESGTEELRVDVTVAFRLVDAG